MTHIDSCPRCDRSRWMTTGKAPAGYCIANYLGGGCNGDTLDWRARTLDAEAQRDRTLASIRKAVGE